MRKSPTSGRSGTRTQPGGGWHFIAVIDKMESEIVHERMRTQPIAVPRYYRIPGEAYGRGTALTAMPSIKTLNKAQELALKSAAIRMLGIWAYRAGGTFNPNTVRMGPGEFWPMQSTGGILGPDVSRLDAASGDLNVANLVIEGLQGQVKTAMNDTRLPDYQGTPKSASEITGYLQQSSEIHIGADGRLISEIMPVIVPRAAEILYEQRFLQTVQSIDNLLDRRARPLADDGGAQCRQAGGDRPLPRDRRGDRRPAAHAALRERGRGDGGVRARPADRPGHHPGRKPEEAGDGRDGQGAAGAAAGRDAAQEAAKAAPKAIAGMPPQQARKGSRVNEPRSDGHAARGAAARPVAAAKYRRDDPRGDGRHPARRPARPGAGAARPDCRIHLCCCRRPSKAAPSSNG
jgi:hypothetical protein